MMPNAEPTPEPTPNMGPCPAGTFGTGDEDCEPCPPGTVTGRPGLPSCRPCPANKIANMDNTACIDPEEECPAGFFGPGGADCERCPDGSITTTAGESECMECPEGTKSDATRTECIPEDEEELCPPGFFAPAGQDECEKCPKGFIVKRPNRRRRCSACPAGKTSNDAGTKCVNMKCIKVGGKCKENGTECCTGLSCNTIANTDGVKLCTRGDPPKCAKKGWLCYDGMPCCDGSTCKKYHTIKKCL